MSAIKKSIGEPPDDEDGEEFPPNDDGLDPEVPDEDNDGEDD